MKALNTLDQQNVKELKKVAKQAGLTGYSNWDKSQLIEEITASTKEPEVEATPPRKIKQRRLPVTVNGQEYVTLTSALTECGLNISTDWLKVRAGLKKEGSIEYEGHIFRQL